MLFILKLQNRGDIRRFAWKEDEPITFSTIQQLTKDTFGEEALEIEPMKQLTFTYKDDSNDNITVTNDRELDEALRLAREKIAPTISVDGTTTPATYVLKLKVKNPKKCSFFNFDTDAAKQWCERIKEKKRQHCEAYRNGGKRRCFPKMAIKGFLFLAALHFVLHLIPHCGRFFFWAVLPLIIIGFVAKKAFGCAFRQCSNRVRSEWIASNRDSRCKRQPQASVSALYPEIKSESIPEVKSEEVSSMESESSNSSFQGKLKQLEEMGFNARSKNIEVLIRNGGDLLRSVKDLLDKRN